MIKVLVVDDKKLIRKGIISFLENSDMVFEKIFECPNGKDAFNLLGRESIDIVITDIRMPEMDGISLMQNAKGIEHIPKFIVVSGYDDFQYAKESINYGARAYILKPLDRKELIDTVRRVISEINNEKKQEIKEEQINLMVKRLQEDELRLILLGGMQRNENVKNTEINGFPFGDTGFYISLITKRINVNSDFDLDPLDVKQKIQGYFNTKPAKYLLIEMGKTHLVISDNLLYINQLLRYLNNDANLYIAAVSDLCTDSTKIRDCYIRLQDTLKYRLYYPDIDIIQADDIFKLNSEYTVPLDINEKICQLIGTNRISQIDEFISEIFNREAVVKYKIGYLEETVRDLYNKLTRITNILPDQWDREMARFEMLNSIYNFDSLKDFLNCLRNSISSLNSYVLSMKSTYREKNEIERAIEYINANYDKNISLTTVSNYVSLNYSYFSHTFKEQTGLSFVEYIRKVRVIKAMELLTNTKLKVFEVAEKVGFDNYKHFGRTFREFVGISPVEYREKAWMQKAVDDKDNKDIKV